MGLFTDSISQILTTQNLQRIGARIKPQQLAQIVRQSSVDSVNFSSEAKNLFAIFENDTFFDTTFGLPAGLNETQQQELQSIQTQLQLLTPSTGTAQSFEKLYDYFTDFMKRFVDETSGKDTQTLEESLKAYVVQQSVGNLFGTDTSGSDIFTTLGNSNLSTLFATTLSSDEQQQLAKLSLQLNRLFFTGTDNTFSPLLERFNNLYGLENPDETTLFEVMTRFDNRNALLADVLRNRAGG